MRVVLSSLILLVVISARAEAQASFTTSRTAAPFESAAQTRVREPKGPTLESAAVGIRPIVSADATAPAQRRSSRRSGVSNDVVLMIVGGAAMVAGAAIGGDAGAIFMVGGAIIGLWGLYNFLQ